MAYDKSKEKTLHTSEIPDWDSPTCNSGTVLQAVQYDTFQPNVVLSRYRVDKETGEKRILPFISIPPSAVERVANNMISLSKYIIEKFPRQPKNQ